MSVNKVILVGFLGSDPEVKMTQTGMQVANVSLATSKKWKDKQGQQQQKTTWHRLIMWDKLAGLASQYLKKGAEIYIEGEIDNRSYENQQGQKVYVSEVIVSNITFLGKKDSGQQAPSSPQGQGQQSGPSYDVQEDVPF